MKDTHGGDIWKASRLTGLPPRKIIDFSANINPLGLSPLAARAMGEALELVGAYPDPEAGVLIQALSDHHGVSRDRILPANGSTELIYLIPGVVRPKSALIVAPAFSEYRMSLESSGCKVDTFLTKEEDSFTLETERLALKLKKGYDILYLANPSNPAGALVDKALLIELAGRCRRHGTLMVVDEAFSDFTERQSIKKEAAEFEGVIVLRSMTKFFSLAGLRLGCMVAEKGLIKRFKDHLQPWAVNTLAIAAGAASLKDTAYMESTFRWFREEKKYMRSELGKLPALKPFPSSANFFLVKLLTDALTGPSLKEVLLEKGVLIRDLSRVRGLDERFFRIALLKRGENEALLDALRSALSGIKSLDSKVVPCYS